MCLWTQVSSGIVSLILIVSDFIKSNIRNIDNFSYSVASLNACLSFSVTVDLSVDALPIDIPGGYVVPERGNVTFTCNSSMREVLPDWKVDFKGLGSTKGRVDSKNIIGTVSNVTSPDSENPNPTSFTVHGIPAESNDSYVECLAGISAKSNATILVEGEGLYLYNTHL